MRRLRKAASAAAMLGPLLMGPLLIGPLLIGIAGCAAVTPSQSALAGGTQWRTADGRPVGDAELAMLRRACLAQPGAVPMDPLGTVASPAAVNPAFHPGGAGLMNTTPIGVASSGAPVAVQATPTGGAAGLPLDACLESKGLVKAP